MFVIENGVIKPSEMDRCGDIAEVACHLGNEMSDDLSVLVDCYLDTGDVLAAAWALAVFADWRRLILPAEHCHILRAAISTHSADLSVVDRLDRRAGNVGAPEIESSGKEKVQGQALTNPYKV